MSFGEFSYCVSVPRFILVITKNKPNYQNMYFPFPIVPICPVEEVTGLSTQIPLMLHALCAAIIRSSVVMNVWKLQLYIIELQSLYFHFKFIKTLLYKSLT